MRPLDSILSLFQGRRRSVDFRSLPTIDPLAPSGCLADFASVPLSPSLPLLQSFLLPSLRPHRFSPSLTIATSLSPRLLSLPSPSLPPSPLLLPLASSPCLTAPPSLAISSLLPFFPLSS